MEEEVELLRRPLKRKQPVTPEGERSYDIYPQKRAKVLQLASILQEGMQPYLQQIGYEPKPRSKSPSEYTQEDIDQRVQGAFHYIEQVATKEDFPLLQHFINNILLQDPLVAAEFQSYLDNVPDVDPRSLKDPRTMIGYIYHAYTNDPQIDFDETLRRRYQFYKYWKQLVFDYASEIQRQQQEQKYMSY